MKTTWILLLCVSGCWNTHIENRAYKTEVECQSALTRAYAESRDSMDSVKAQCESVDSLLEETNKK